MSKPEYQGPPEEYYNEKEARKYTSNSRIQQVGQIFVQSGLAYVC